MRLGVATLCGRSHLMTTRRLRRENRGMTGGAAPLACKGYYTRTDPHRSGNSPLILLCAPIRISACANSIDSNIQEAIPHE
jgi:hypothetical protein